MVKSGPAPLGADAHAVGAPLMTDNEVVQIEKSPLVGA